MKFKPTLLALVVSASSTAHAQIEPDAATLAYLRSKPFGDMTVVVGISLDKIVLGMERCEGSYGFDPVSFDILQPLKFSPGVAQPVAGQWTFRFKLNRCSASKIYNVQWQANPTGTPKPAILPPGMSRANLALALDLKNVVASEGLRSHAVPQQCRSVRIVDTSVSMEPTALTIDGVRRDGVWEEQWTAQMCGVEFKSAICLVPAAGGGTDWMSKPCPR